LSPNEYQQKCLEYALPTSLNSAYLVSGLCSEAGEVAGAYAKWIRDGASRVVESEAYCQNIKKEVGDVLWFCATLSDYYGFDLESVMRHNIEKLEDRKQRNVISGSGDDR
jgi:NTP pyrophosphatase (non-canonical NTP hydrolase)